MVNRVSDQPGRSGANNGYQTSQTLLLHVQNVDKQYGSGDERGDGAAPCQSRRRRWSVYRDPRTFRRWQDDAAQHHRRTG